MTRLGLFLLFASIWSVTFAQDAASLFRSRSDLVLVPVIVENKDGSHATGMTKESFTIEQDGHVQKLAVFSEIVPLPGRYEPVKTESPNQYTNYIPKDEVRRLVIIVFDMLFTPATERQKVQTYLEDYAMKNVSSQQPTALLVAQRQGMTQLQSFTTDPTTLIAAIRRVRQPSSRKIETDSRNLQFSQHNPDKQSPEEAEQAAIQAEIKAMMERGAESADRYELKSRIDQLVWCLESVGQAYSTIPGRKALIWLSNGFPFAIYDKGTSDGTDNTGMLSGPEMNKVSAAIRALGAANISVYPVDTRGVVDPMAERYTATRIGSPERIGTDSQLEGPGLRKPIRDTIPLAGWRDNLDTMEKFARETGGKVCAGRNDLDTCLKKAVDDSSQYYLLGFYLAPEERAPGWHKLVVKVSNKESAVRSRQRFFVESNLGGGMTWLESVKEAATSPINYTGVQFTAERGESTADGKTNFLFTIPVSALTHPDGQLSVEVIAFVEDRNGNIRLENNKRLEANVPQTSAQRQMRSGIKYTAAVKLGTNDKAVKLAVRDNYRQTIGTIRIPLQ